MHDRSIRLHAVNCTVCSAQFMAQQQDIRRGFAKYCSGPCERAGRAAMAADPIRVATRFWKKVRKDGPRRYGLSPCWLWQAAMFTQSGYGAFVFCGERVGAHRVAWFLRHGTWPTLHCLHRCDVRNCVNPNHLYEGTHQENMADMARRGRCRKPGNAEPREDLRSKFRGQSKLSPDDVRAIRAAYIPGETTLVGLGRRFGVSYRTIALTVERKIWKDVPDEPEAERLDLASGDRGS